MCHGTPSPKGFESHLKSIADINGIDNISFRESSKPVLSFNYGENKQYRKPFYSDDYFLAFEIGVNLREVCYQCPYADINRAGDITLGDFHSVNQENSGHPTDNGTSMVLINTEKGRALFDRIENRVVFEEKTVELAKKGNPQLSHPAKAHEKHQAYVEGCKNGESCEVLKKIMKNEKKKYTLINSLAENKLVGSVLSKLGK